ncbi:hypothetical protein C8Q70DRAFT_131562 [Cubamyces menziesii]|nr:hypothetical protein C8Q70DRAFT_131562 [Cubamyces menziesii]
MRLVLFMECRRSLGAHAHGPLRRPISLCSPMPSPPPANEECRLGLGLRSAPPTTPSLSPPPPGRMALGARELSTGQLHSRGLGHRVFRLKRCALRTSLPILDSRPSLPPAPPHTSLKAAA